ncbi:MAG: creatininase family protein, partial [Betaproteobacteria bacterium]|nr:creatininase family protein [Betaproteobacteria bacterium]
MRAAACRWRSSDACAATTTSCCAPSRPNRRCCRRALRCADTARWDPAAFLYGILLFASACALAHAQDSVYIEQLTTTEVQAALAAGKTTIIIPIGGTEQSGPHMVLGKHDVRVRILAGRIAAALGNALVAPVVAYVPEGSVDPPSSHMRFAGTISIPVDVFERTLEAAARSFAAHGFRDIVFIGDHGGYQRSEEAVAKRLDREWARRPARAHAILEYYRVTETDYVRALEARGLSRAEIGTHAGVADTSLSLALDPKLVRMGVLRAGKDLDVAHGVYGDPRRSSAEL